MDLDDYDDVYELRFYGLGILMEIEISCLSSCFGTCDLGLAILFDYLNIEFY